MRRIGDAPSCLPHMRPGPGVRHPLPDVVLPPKYTSSVRRRLAPPPGSPAPPLVSPGLPMAPIAILAHTATGCDSPPVLPGLAAYPACAWRARPRPLPTVSPLPILASASALPFRAVSSACPSAALSSTTRSPPLPPPRASGFATRLTQTTPLSPVGRSVAPTSLPALPSPASAAVSPAPLLGGSASTFPP